MELHRNGCRFNQNQWLVYLKRVNILWYINCTQTHQKDEQPTLQTNFFSTVSGHPLSHRNIEMSAKMPDMDNHTATNTVSKPSTSRPGGQTQGLTCAIRQVLVHWAIAPTPFSSFGAGSDVVQPGLKPSLNEADEIPSIGHCDRIQFLFKKTICRHQLVSHMLCGFFILASETLCSCDLSHCWLSEFFSSSWGNNEGLPFRGFKMMSSRHRQQCCSPMALLYDSRSSRVL